MLFEDLLSQQLNGAGAARPPRTGGTNPAQVGLGVRLTGISINFAQGATQLTGRSTDFAIQGDGFFAVDQGGQTAYTRNGSFSLDGNGNLVTADGAFVKGWQADQNGNVNTNASVGHLKIPVGQIINPITTTHDEDRRQPAGRRRGRHDVDAGINVNNSLGTSVPLRAEFTKVADAAGRSTGRSRPSTRANNLDRGPDAGHVRPERRAHERQRHRHPGAAQHDRGHDRHVGAPAASRSTSAPRPTPTA